MPQGWIKLHRKIIEWEWYHDPKMVLLFIHLMMTANHETQNWKGVEVLRGQTVTGLDSLNKATGISIQSLRTCLSRLEKTGELTSKSTNRFRIITLCNYESYQITNGEANKPTNKQLTSQQQATNKQLTANKNVKNDKNEKNVKKKGGFTPPTIDQINGYIKEKGYDVDGKTFFDYFTESGWVDSRGNKVKNWKQKIITWSGNGRRTKTTGRQHPAMRQESTTSDTTRRDSFANQKSNIGTEIQ